MLGPRGVSKQLRALFVLAEDLNSISESTYYTTIHNSSSGESTSSSELNGHQAHTWYTQMHSSKALVLVNLILKKIVVLKAHAD